MTIAHVRAAAAGAAAQFGILVSRFRTLSRERQISAQYRGGRPFQLPQSELSRLRCFADLIPCSFDFISLFVGFISRFGQLGNPLSDASLYQ
jgi:hypothetical protein